MALYPSHWRATSNIRAKTNPIAVLTVGPAMRGGLRPWVRAMRCP